MQHVDRFAATLILRVGIACLVVVACVAAAFALRPVDTISGATGFAVLALLAGMATLALSALLLFDAFLFRVIASFGGETTGGSAVDDLLQRMRLKPAPSVVRPLADRIAGTRRLMRLHLGAAALCVACTIALIAKPA